MYIDDCLDGTQTVCTQSDIVEPLNLGSDELVTINQLVDIVEDIAGVKLKRNYNLDAPKGVSGRNSDNTLIKASSGLGALHPARRRHGEDLSLDLRRDDLRQGIHRQRPAPRCRGPLARLTVVGHERPRFAEASRVAAVMAACNGGDRGPVPGGDCVAR